MADNMFNIAQIEEINDQLRKFGRVRRLVANARALRNDDGRWFELTAAVWTDSQLTSHTEVVPIRDFNRLGAACIADRFIEVANGMFPPRTATSVARDIQPSALTEQR